MRDPLGNTIEEGWAAQVDAGRGSSRIHKVYVLGTKGKSVVVLTKRWNDSYPPPVELEYIIEAYKEGNKEVYTYLKTPTRIIMLDGDNK